MRRSLFGLLALAVLSPAVAIASASAQAFEGVISMHMPGAGRDGQPNPDIEYMARGGKLRVNVKSPLGQLGMIGVPAEKKIYLLMDAQRMYAEQPMQIDASAAAASAMRDAVVTRTGRKETIAGVECEHLLVATQRDTTDLCITKSLGTFFAATMGMNVPAWQRRLMADGAFPLRVSRKDGTTQMEVTKVERKRLTDAMFTVPEDYARMDMPGMKRPPA